jgi:hypothetical protein
MGIFSNPAFSNIRYSLLCSITKKVVAQRFGPNKKVERDMLGSFIAHGLNQEEAESETVIQM